MNYLAHILLSGSDAWTQTGGFTADAVKGKDWMEYPKRMQQGILHHRAIDSYTDSHPVVSDLKRELRPLCGRYAGIVLDVWFDYLIASDFRAYSPMSLRRFVWRFYFSVLWRYYWLPRRIKRFIFHFVSTDRLTKYCSPEGIKESLDIMVYYRELPINTESVVAYLCRHEERFRREFNRFFSDLSTQYPYI